MAQPSTAIERLDLSLSYAEFTQSMQREEFVGLQILQPVLVAKSTAKYQKFPAKALLQPIVDTVRAPGGAYKSGDIEWEWGTYSTDDHGFEVPLDDRLSEMYAEFLNYEMAATNQAVNRVAYDLENTIANAVFNTTTWTGASLTTDLVDAERFSNKAAADPITSLLNAKAKVYDSCGRDPNRLVIPRKAIDAMFQCASVIDRYKYAGFDNPTMGNVSAYARVLAELLDIEQVIVVRGTKNSAGEGLTATFARLWNQTMAMMMYQPSDPLGDIMLSSPRIGVVPMWQKEIRQLPGGGDSTMGIIVEEYRNEEHRGGRIRARCDWGIEIQRPECGHLITNVLAG